VWHIFSDFDLKIFSFLGKFLLFFDDEGTGMVFYSFLGLILR